jgi:hypothetical protein
LGRTITAYLIGLRQADLSQVPPDRARYGLPRPMLSPVRRTVRPCCARGPLMARRPDVRVRRPGAGGCSWRDRDVKDRGAHPLGLVEPDREFHASLADGRSAGGWRLPSRADQHRSTKAMTSGNVGHFAFGALEPANTTMPLPAPIGSTPRPANTPVDLPAASRWRDHELSWCAPGAVGGPSAPASFWLAAA